MDFTTQIKNAESLNGSMFTEITEDDFSKAMDQEDNIIDDSTFADEFNLKEEQEGSEGNPQPTTHNPQPNYSFIDSGVAIGVIDSILPAAIVWAYAAIMDRKVNRSDFKLTADEKRTLEPIIKECLKTINIDLSNPWKALLIVGGMIYGGKVFTAESVKIEKGEVRGKDKGVSNEYPEPRIERRGRPKGSFKKR